MSGHSLEDERQAILDRMAVSRERYRRMLHNQPEVIANAAHPVGRHAVYALPDDRFPRSAAMRWVAQHPVLCAAAIAAVVVIGPARIVRTAMKGGSAATSLTLRNSPNIDTIGRLISIVADVAARIPMRTPPR
ncbi:MAG TPA: hypothetical protein VF450_19200 [Noviherbaspirillum sp.]|jgi:hypothetical protein